MQTVYLLIAFIALGIIIALLNKYTRPSKKKAPASTSAARKKEASTSSKKINSEEDFSGLTLAEKQAKAEEAVQEYIRPEGCCGSYDVCENEVLLASHTEIVYFDDEELDAFKKKDPTTYTEEEIAQFEEVFFTLREDELIEWLKSLQLRHIALPPSIQDQALMIISERRKQAAKA